MYTYPLSMYIYPLSMYIYIFIFLLGESFSDARHETQTNPVKKLRIDNALTFTGEGGSIYLSNYHICLLSIYHICLSCLSTYHSYLSIYLSISHIYLSNYHICIYIYIYPIYLSIHLSIYHIYLFLS